MFSHSNTTFNLSYLWQITEGISVTIHSAIMRKYTALNIASFFSQIMPFVFVYIFLFFPWDIINKTPLSQRLSGNYDSPKSSQVMLHQNARGLTLLLVKAGVIPLVSVGFHPLTAEERLACGRGTKQLHCHHFVGLLHPRSSTRVYPVQDEISFYNIDPLHTVEKQQTRYVWQEYYNVCLDLSQT